ncbi:hypothetical protein [Streptomyces wuyuanensis]|uniref:hypothetical protein n=1 Tax=Streptomyces wuyuanensis TaxID=1196353 RepID=UPI003429354C
MRSRLRSSLYQQIAVAGFPEEEHRGVPAGNDALDLLERRSEVDGETRFYAAGEEGPMDGVVRKDWREAVGARQAVEGSEDVHRAHHHDPWPACLQHRPAVCCARRRQAGQGLRDQVVSSLQVDNRRGCTRDLHQCGGVPYVLAAGVIKPSGGIAP